MHEERVCERHFDDNMFVNDYHNRLHQTAVPVLYLCEDASFLPSLAFPVKVDTRCPARNFFLRMTDTDWNFSFSAGRQGAEQNDECTSQIRTELRRRKFNHSIQFTRDLVSNDCFLYLKSRC